MDWHNIDYIGVCREAEWQPERSEERNRKYAYYLVAHSKDDQMETDSPAQKSYRATLGAGLDIPLDALFLQTTPEKVQRILRRVVTQYAVEIQLYDIEVGTELHDVGSWLLP